MSYEETINATFGGILLTSSVGLSTVNNATNVIKQEQVYKNKNQQLMETEYQVNKQSGLTKETINKVKLASKSWDEKTINQVLNRALQYNDGKLTINKSKLDISKVPSEVLLHINLALENLNNTINAGYIKVTLENNIVKLIYPTSSLRNNLMSNNASHIIDFAQTHSTHKKMLLTSSPIWLSTYGPSHWWRFWEWGAYIHFSENLIPTVKTLNAISSIVNIYFIFKNIREIVDIVKQIGSALSIGNTAKANSFLPKLSKYLNNANLTILGTIYDILGIFTSITILIIALWNVPTIGQAAIALIEAATSIVVAITNQMLAADRGHGVKWQWAMCIFPWAFSAE